MTDDILGDAKIVPTPAAQEPRRPLGYEPPRAADGFPLPLANVLGEIRGFIRSYVVLTEHQLNAITLWVAHTYALDAAQTTPYIAISSPEKRSGKSRLLDALELIVRNPWRTVMPSEAVVYRRIEADAPTLLLDEIDTIWGPKAQEHEGLRALLNAGFRRMGSNVPRCHGPKLEVRDFSTYCAKAFSGIGSSSLPDTVADRSILIRMAKKRASEKITRFNQRDVMPIAARLKGIIEAAMTDELVEELAEARPELPHELDDRAQDSWEALFAIADHAGGHWPVTARRSAVALATGRDGDESSLAHRLLVDTRTVFEELAPDETRLTTGTLITHLVAIPDSPWGDLRGKPVTGRTIKRLLGEYEISPFHSGDFRGYRRADFGDAWARYASQSVQSVQSGSQSGIPAIPKVSGNSSADTLDAPGLRLNHAGSDTTDALNRNAQGDHGTAHGVVPLNHAVSSAPVPDQGEMLLCALEDDPASAEATALAADIRERMDAAGHPGSTPEDTERILGACMADVRQGGTAALGAVETLRRLAAFDLQGGAS